MDREALKIALAELPAGERRVVVLRFFGGKSPAEIAELLGTSQAHVRGLLSRTLERLHDSLMATA
ncbi:RNA polymerase sigma factor (sigma-70 family) [Spinactinospora alkalitolerans]|uniref:RNA polymerase sigma factor (Sigma-70 family) n=1 Tax=Spinactinospora alkalitolerans TaxID=687207 RepID=A0A852TWT9_9ACTN|nr:RNA polymerase sigma factor (sigma-70 family) [Spinactinospora alkalitolerans]